MQQSSEGSAEMVNQYGAQGEGNEEAPWPELKREFLARHSCPSRRQIHKSRPNHQVETWPGGFVAPSWKPYCH